MSKTSGPVENGSSASSRPSSLQELIDAGDLDPAEYYRNSGVPKPQSQPEPAPTERHPRRHRRYATNTLARRHMEELGVDLRDLADDMGVSYDNLRRVTGGLRPTSRLVALGVTRRLYPDAPAERKHRMNGLERVVDTPSLADRLAELFGEGPYHAR